MEKLLMTISKNVKIDLSEKIPDIMEGIIMRELLKEVHKYKITMSGDRWTTRVPDPTKPKGLRQVKKKSRADLYKYLLEFYAIAETSKDITFGELFTEWIEYKRQFVGAKNKGLSPSTIRRYERDYANYLAASNLAGNNVNKITAVFLQSELKNIIEINGGNKNHRAMYMKCFKNIFGYINEMYEYAIQKQYVTEAPIKYVDKRLLLTFCEPDPIKPDKDRVLTTREMSALFTAVMGHERRHCRYMPNYAIELAMLTGMRVGEIAALHWTDIDDEYIHVNYSEHRLDYVDRPCEYVIGEPKNRKHRHIPITPEISALFARIRALNVKGDYIFSRNDGTRYRGHDVSCAVDRRAAEAGISKTSIHGIRRTVSSMLIAGGLPRITVANLLGHLPTTNERFYDYDFVEKADVVKIISDVSHSVTLFSVNMTDKKIAESR